MSGSWTACPHAGGFRASGGPRHWRRGFPELPPARRRRDPGCAAGGSGRRNATYIAREHHYVALPAEETQDDQHRPDRPHAGDLDRAAAFRTELLGGELMARFEPPGLVFLNLVFSDDDGTLGPAGEQEWMAFIRDSDGNLAGLVSRHPAGN